MRDLDHRCDGELRRGWRARVALGIALVAAPADARPEGGAGAGTPSDVPMPAVGKELPAAAVFQRASPSVYVVRARATAADSSFSQGSGVAIAADLIVTNYHVIKGRPVLEIERDGTKRPAKLEAFDEAHDLALLKVEGLKARVARVRRAPEVTVGERVYAIGSPRGLELTFSDGLVSALRDSKGAKIIQTSAPISPGSSGGGLFDASGQLIGITTFTAVASQNLNFAHPVVWIDELRDAKAPSSAGEVAAVVTPAWDISHRPPRLECTADRQQVWAFFSSGDEILDSAPANELYLFIDFDRQTPIVERRGAPTPERLVLANMDRKLGWLSYVPETSETGTRPRTFYLVDVSEGDFQFTKFIYFDFHGQPRYRAFTGACRVPELPKTVSRARADVRKNDPSEDGGTCLSGVAARCIAEASALPQNHSAARLGLLRRGCELGDRPSCDEGEALADSLGMRSEAASMRFIRERIKSSGATP